MSIFKGLDSVLSKTKDGEILIDTDVDYSKVDATKKVEETPNPEKKKEEEKDKVKTDLIDVSTDIDLKENEVKDTIEDPEVSNIYKPLASLLKEEGILPTLDLEKFEGKPDELIAGIQAEIKDGINSYKETLHPSIKDLADKWEEGVPMDEYISIKSEQTRFDNIDENTIKEDVELQKNLVAYHLSQTTKWNENKIKKEVDRLADTDELESEAYDAHKELKKLAVEAEKQLLIQAKKDQEEAKNKQKKLVEDIEKTVNGLTEIIPGIKISEKEKQGLLKSVTKPVEFDKDNKPVSKVMKAKEKDPIKFELMLNYFIDQGFFDGKFEKIITKAKSDSLKELEKQATTNLNKMGKVSIDSDSKGATLLNAFKINKNKN